MLDTSFDSNSFQILFDSTPISGNIAYTNNIATFTPDQPLSLLTSYTAQLTPVVTSADSTPLSNNYNWQFRTKNGAWDKSKIISLNNADYTYVDSLVDPNDNLVVMYKYNNTTLNQYMFNVYNTKNNWNNLDPTTSRLVISTSNSFSLLKMSTDSNGNILFLFSETDLNGAVNLVAIYYSINIPLNLWFPTATVISKDTGNFVNGIFGVLDVQYDKLGNLIVFWSQHDSLGVENIWVNRYSINNGINSWNKDSAKMINTSPTNHIIRGHLPSALMDSSGNVLFVWAQLDNIVFNLVANYYDAATPWLNWNPLVSQKALETTPDDISYFLGKNSVAMDKNGNAIIVWFQSGGIWALRYDSNISWVDWTATNAIRLDNGSPGPFLYPTIKMDDKGNAIALWIQNRVMANRYDASKDWNNNWSTQSAKIVSSKIVINNFGTANSVPILRIMPNGSAMFFWLEPRPEIDFIAMGDQIIVNYFDYLQGWQNMSSNNAKVLSLEIIENGNNYSTLHDLLGYFDIVVDKSNNALLFWQELNSSYVYYNRFQYSQGFESLSNSTSFNFWATTGILINGKLKIDHEGRPILTSKYGVSASAVRFE